MVWLYADVCAGHSAYYTPSTTPFFNFSIEDDTFYGEGSEFQSWRVNDSVTFGTVTNLLPFGAAFNLAGQQPLDGKLMRAPF
jgi:hypothetical protein